MEWNQEKCLKLIELYKQRSVLWDPHDPNYFKRVLKTEAWLQIASALGGSMEETKKKMEILLGSFRRERARMRNDLRKGVRRTSSKWYAFKKMRFLLNKHAPHRVPDEIEETKDASKQNGIRKRKRPPSVDDLCDITVSYNDDANVASSSTLTSTTPSSSSVDSSDDDPKQKRTEEQKNKSTPSNQKESRIQKKKKKHNSSYNAATNNNIKNNTMLEYCNQPPLLHEYAATSYRNQNYMDEYDIYGRYIASKLRNLDQGVRVFTQRALNNVMFNADLGKYDDNRQSPSVVLLDYDEDGALYEAYMPETYVRSTENSP